MNELLLQPKKYEICVDKTDHSLKISEGFLQPRIYVECVDADDYLIPGCGQWMDANQSPEVLEQAATQLLEHAKPWAQKWQITKTQDLGFGSSVVETLAMVHERALLVLAQGNAFIAACQISVDLEMAKWRLKNDYKGVYASQADFAALLVEAGDYPVCLDGGITDPFLHYLFYGDESTETLPPYQAIVLDGLFYVFSMQCIDGEWI